MSHAVQFVLLPQPDCEKKEIMFWYCTLFASDWRLATTDKECQCRVQAVLFLLLIFQRNRFFIQTDNKNLKRLLTISNTTKNLTRSRIWRSVFKLYLVHRAGMKQQAAVVPWQPQTKGPTKLFRRERLPSWFSYPTYLVHTTALNVGDTNRNMIW